MRRLIASDLHGSVVYTEQLVALYRASGAGQLVLLGDLFFSGSYDPRYGYDPEGVAELLAPLAGSLVWVEGNCDRGAERLLPVPAQPRYVQTVWDGHAVFLTHGHRYGPSMPPPQGTAELLLSGHTHVPAFGRVGDLICACPGSVSLPRGGSARGVLLYEDGLLRWLGLDGQELRRARIWPSAGPA